MWIFTIDRPHVRRIRGGRLLPSRGGGGVRLSSRLETREKKMRTRLTQMSLAK